MFENETSDYKLISKKIQVMFQLDKSPVAVKLFEDDEEAKKLLPLYTGKEILTTVNIYPYLEKFYKKRSNNLANRYIKEFLQLAITEEVKIRDITEFYEENKGRIANRFKPSTLKKYETVLKQFLAYLTNINEIKNATVSSENHKEKDPYDKGTERHCGLVFNTAKNKSSYYITLDEIACPNGAMALGLLDGELMKGVPTVKTTMKAVGYAPLEKSPFKPDSVVLYCNPIQIMKITQILRQATGKRINADFGAIASVCADVVSKPYLTKQTNVSFACNGSRGFSDIKPDEVIIGLTMEDILSIVNY